MLIFRFWKDHRNEFILSDASSGPDQCLQIVGAFDTGRRFARDPQELVKCKAGMVTCICDSKSGYQLQCGHVELQVSAIFASKPVEQPEPVYLLSEITCPISNSSRAHLPKAVG